VWRPPPPDQALKGPFKANHTRNCFVLFFSPGFFFRTVPLSTLSGFLPGRVHRLFFLDPSAVSPFFRKASGVGTLTFFFFFFSFFFVRDPLFPCSLWVSSDGPNSPPPGTAPWLSAFLNRFVLSLVIVSFGSLTSWIFLVSPFSCELYPFLTACGASFFLFQCAILCDSRLFFRSDPYFSP